MSLILLLLCSSQVAYPQARTIVVFVNPAQGLGFGAFYQGVAGGSVIIAPDGTRSVTGSVVPANLGFLFSPLLVEIDADAGTLITIMNGPDVMLNGSNGGSMLLHIGTASTGSPFITSVTPPARTQVRIGGTLSVGSSAANPAGAYSGSFSITFIQE